VLLPRSDASTPHSWRVSHAPWRPLRDGHIVGRDVGRARVFPRSFSGWRQFVSNESIRVRETSNHSNMAGRRRYRPFFGPGQVSRRSWVHWIWGLQWENCQRHLISLTVAPLYIPPIFLTSAWILGMLHSCCHKTNYRCRGMATSDVSMGNKCNKLLRMFCRGVSENIPVGVVHFWIVASIAGVAE